LKPLNRLLGVFIISLVLALILGMGIISYFVNVLLQPIKTLREAVQSFARKDFSARVSVYSADEIGELVIVQYHGGNHRRLP
jgi:HAMP domain-containing protein